MVIVTHFAEAVQYPTMLLGSAGGSLGGFLFGRGTLKNFAVNLFDLPNPDGYINVDLDDDGDSNNDGKIAVLNSQRTMRRRKKAPNRQQQQMAPLTSAIHSLVYQYNLCECIGAIWGVAVGAWPGVLLRFGMAGIEELEEDLEEVFGLRRTVITIAGIILLVLYYLAGMAYIISVFSDKLDRTAKNRSRGKMAKKEVNTKKKEKRLKDELEKLEKPWKTAFKLKKTGSRKKKRI